MTPGWFVVLMMNNYFHDVATAMLLACSIVLRILLGLLDGERDAVLARYASRLFRGMTVIFWSAVLWIALSGIVRIITFRRFEWINATQKHYEAGLLFKYAIAAVMMIVGTVLWRRLSRAMRDRLR